MSHVVNPITVRLGGPTLTVVGRRSGRPISTPVPPLVYQGARYLVAGGGQTHWVRNLRAAGRGELGRGRSREAFRGVEVHGEEHDRIVADRAVQLAVGPLPEGRAPKQHHRSA